MSGFEVGDRVRLDIPDKDDADFERLHGQTGEIKETMKDDAGLSTGDERDSILYRVELDSGDTVDVRWRDIRIA
jgi:ribosomal protein L21E